MPEENMPEGMPEDGIKHGDIILYCLLKKDRPDDPNRLWKGKVEKVHAQTAWSHPFYRVSMLEPGYEGETEVVLLSQVRKVQRE